MSRTPRLACHFILCLAFTGAAASLPSQSPVSRRASHAEPGTSQAGSTEARAVRAYATAVRGGPLTTYAFLRQFPKGTDLHVHLSGAIYAETFLRDAAEDGVCIDPAALKFVKPPCGGDIFPASRLSGAMSGADQELYDRLVDAFSMRGFVPVSGVSGHDQFFATFARFGGLDKRHAGEWVDDVATLAASQNQQYLELMQTPPFGNAAALSREVSWPDGPDVDFGQIRQALLDKGLRNEVPADIADVGEAEQKRESIEHCGTTQAASACKVQVRFIYQVLRGNPPAQVFAQALLGFETVQRSMETGQGGFVGINFVQPEDGYLSMRDYTLQMKMVGYLHSVYPRVHISLHAGELAPGLVPPSSLRFHIRQAVELAHAERIGHGVDLMFEDNPSELLKEMAARHVMVEVNLSSNEGILGIKGNEHPFSLYRAAHVPVSLSTDDEGVSRIEITREYVRAALDYHLTYSDLKQISRTGLEHSFLAGESLWARADEFGLAAPDCHGQLLGSENPSAACRAFLKANEKAAAQWELERRFRAFEAGL